MKAQVHYGTSFNLACFSLLSSSKAAYSEVEEET